MLLPWNAFEQMTINRRQTLLLFMIPDPFLNTCGVSEEERKSLLNSSKPLQEDCSCGISAILESRSQKAINQGKRLAAAASISMGENHGEHFVLWWLDDVSDSISCFCAQIGNCIQNLAFFCLGKHNYNMFCLFHQYLFYNTWCRCGWGKTDEREQRSVRRKSDVDANSQAQQVSRSAVTSPDQRPGTHPALHPPPSTRLL